MIDGKNLLWDFHKKIHSRYCCTRFAILQHSNKKLRYQALHEIGNKTGSNGNILHDNPLMPIPYEKLLFDFGKNGLLTTSNNNQLIISSLDFQRGPNVTIKGTSSRISNISSCNLTISHHSDDHHPELSSYGYKYWPR